MVSNSTKHPGFHPSTFCYYYFLLEVEFIKGCCKLWLKQHSNLLKPLEVALFFVCDKWYIYCVITSNIQNFPILRFHINTPKICPLADLSFMNTKWFQSKKVNSWFLSIIICQGCTWFSMIPNSTKDVRNKILWCTKKQIGV